LLKTIKELLDEERGEEEFIPPVGGEDESAEELLEAEMAGTESDEIIEKEVIGEYEPQVVPESEPGIIHESEAITGSRKETVPESDIIPETEAISGTRTGKPVQKVVDIPRSPQDEVSNYEVSNLKQNFKITGELHNQPVGDVARAVMEVVEVEGPIHYVEVVKRIRTHWGLSRAGRRIQAIMKEAVELTLMDGSVIRKGDFLYYKDAPITVRRRTGKQAVKMDYISEEEIGLAIDMVLKSQYATEPDELVREVVRLFGAKLARGPAVNRVNSVIKSLIKEGEVEERPDGMIDLVRD
jgi:hypothetical protein